MSDRRLRMEYSEDKIEKCKQRIVQELVPGRQITLAHLIANPDKTLYSKLGLEFKGEVNKSAIGVFTVSPAETVIIFADIAMKAAGVEVGYINYTSGSLVITGTVSAVEASMEAIINYGNYELGYTICNITRS